MLMHLRVRSLVLPVCVAACAVSRLAAPAAHAQTILDTNTTINYAINDIVQVGKVNSPTVSLVSGGSVSGSLDVFNSSTFSVSGGSVRFALSVHDSSTVNISDGSLGNALFAQGSSTVNLSGGSVAGILVAYGSSTVNVSGGNVGDDFEATSSSTINLFGTGLTDLLVDPNADNGFFSQYSVSGRLQDGTVLANKTLLVRNGSNARFTLNNAVPEPGSLALLAGVCVTGVGVLARRRTRRK